MTYTPWSVIFGEQPSASKWNQLGENDDGFDLRITDLESVIPSEMTKVVTIDPAVAVLSQTNKTTEDNTWVDLDLTSNVSATAIAAILVLRCRDNVAFGARMSVRKNGSTDTSLALSGVNPVANNASGSQVEAIVGLDANKLIETNTNWTTSGNNLFTIDLVGYIETVVIP